LAVIIDNEDSARSFWHGVAHGLPSRSVIFIQPPILALRPFREKVLPGVRRVLAFRREEEKEKEVEVGPVPNLLPFV
jgi:hypothetical protein